MTLTGLACGALAGGAGLALWNSFHPVAGVSRAVVVIRWVAAALVAVAAALAWQGPYGFPRPAQHLIIMAALAAPPKIQRRDDVRWSQLLRILPALVLTGVGLTWATMPVEASAGDGPATLVELAVTVCGGLGARSLGLALSEARTSPPHIARTSSGTYALLTLIVGGLALMNLWQRGTVWDGTVGESGLAGAWLAWSASRVNVHPAAWLRTVLTAVAAVSLIVLAVVYPIAVPN